MSDMKNDLASETKSNRAVRTGSSARHAFTVRDMNRQPATLLKACDALGVIIIRSRNGRTYRLVSDDSRARDSVISDETTSRRAAALERMRRYQDAIAAIAAPRKKWTQAQIAHINSIIAGDA